MILNLGRSSLRDHKERIRLRYYQSLKQIHKGNLTRYSMGIHLVLAGYSLYTHWRPIGYSLRAQWILNGYSVGTHQVFTRYLLLTYWVLTGYLMGTHWVFTEYSLDTHWVPTGYLLGTNWEHKGDPLVTGYSLGIHQVQHIKYVTTYVRKQNQNRKISF